MSFFDLSQSVDMRNSVEFPSIPSAKEYEFQVRLREYIELLCPDVEKNEAFNLINKGHEICGKLYNDELCADERADLLSDTRNAVAISWYLKALAIWDGEEFVGGAIQIVDPGHRIHNFLDSFPNSYWRESTHAKKYRDKSVEGTHFAATKILSKLGNPLIDVKMGQRGLDVRGCKMPAGKNTILFGKLKTGRHGHQSTYIKFEESGSPRIFDRQHLGSPLRSISEATRHLQNLLQHIAHKRRIKGKEDLGVRFFEGVGGGKKKEITTSDDSQLNLRSRREDLDPLLNKKLAYILVQEFIKIDNGPNIDQSMKEQLKQELAAVYDQMGTREIVAMIENKMAPKKEKFLSDTGAFDYEEPFHLENSELTDSCDHVVQKQVIITASINESDYEDMLDAVNADREKGVSTKLDRMGLEYITEGYRSDFPRL